MIATSVSGTELLRTAVAGAAVKMDEYNGLPVKQALYDPRFETDACGVGYVVNIDGIRSQKVSFMDSSCCMLHVSLSLSLCSL